MYFWSSMTGVGQSNLSIKNSRYFQKIKIAKPFDNTLKVLRIFQVSPDPGNSGFPVFGIPVILPSRNFALNKKSWSRQNSIAKTFNFDPGLFNQEKTKDDN